MAPFAIHNYVSTCPYPEDLQEALQAQNRHGYGRLCFAQPLEVLFRDDLVDSGRRIRIILFLLFFVTALALPAISRDILGSPPVMAHYFNPIIYGQAPLMLGGAIATWRVPLSRLVDWLCIASYVVLAGAVLTGRAMGVHYGFNIPLIWIAIATTAILVAAGLRFWFTLPWVALVTAATFINEALFVARVPNDYFVVMTLLLLIVVTAIGGYSLEYFMRKTWVNSRLLDHISSHDSLTGLLNRKALYIEMQHVIAHTRRERKAFAVAMVDIDYFKDYNDHYGHRAGDLVLHAVAKILQTATRRPHDLCGRYGGEEFIVVWTGRDRADLCAMAKALCANVAGANLRHEYSRVSDVITVSIGVCVVEPDQAWAPSGLLTGDPEGMVTALWDAADRPLYRAKTAGRNRVVCVGGERETMAANDGDPRQLSGT